MNPRTNHSSDHSSDQQRLCDEVLDLAGANGSDCKDVLDGLDAPAQDKAAVADALGGPGAGYEYLPAPDDDADGM